MSLPTVDQYLNRLRSELGTTEHPFGSNHQEFSTQLHRPDEAWCADFLIAMADRVGLGLPGRSAYTPDLADSFRHAGRFGSRPAKGAFVFFRWPGMGRIAHVACVEAVNQDGSIGTIEGNTDERGGRTGGKVMRHRRQANIVGYGYPVYGAPVARTVKRPAGVPAWWTHTIKLHSVSQETASLCVRLGVKKRVTFDVELDKLVRSVQKAHHLHLDGIVGPETAKAIG